MPRVCCITGKKPLFGNSISHSKVSTRRKFDINLKKGKRIYVPELKCYVKLNISSSGLRNIAKAGKIIELLYK